jgi:hypothetical protein
MIVLLVINFVGNKKTRLKSHSLIVVGLLMTTMAFCQEKQDDLGKSKVRKNSVDITLGGSGLFLSTNYSRVIMAKPNYFINASVGIGTVIMTGGITLPHQLTFNFGKKSSFLELGLGGTFWTGKSNDSGYTETINSYYLSPIVGWRKNFKNNLVFRVYTNPLFYISGEESEHTITPYAGISLGYSF